MRRTLLPILLLLTSLTGSAKLAIVTTHTVLADIAHEVGGENVEIRCLVPPNVDPHTFEPRPSDLALLAQAQLVVMNGVGLEPWAEKFIANSGFHGKIIKVGERAPRLIRLTGDNETQKNAEGDTENRYDPHVWQNPRNVEYFSREICDALAALLPASRAEFESRTERYCAELRLLEEYARERFQSIPATRRILVTSHDSLRYLADEYGFSIITIAGLQPDREPAARDLAELIKTARLQHVPAIFVEATSSPKLSRVVAEEANVAVVAELYTDSLGAPGSIDATYLGMFRANVDIIVRALK